MTKHHSVCMNCASILIQRFFKIRRKTPEDHNSTSLEYFTEDKDEFCELCDHSISKGYWIEKPYVKKEESMNIYQEMCVGCLIRKIFDFLAQGIGRSEPIQEIKNAKSIEFLYEHSDKICKICMNNRQEANVIIKPNSQLY